MNDYDGLRLCIRCHDRETTNESGVCHVCRQQEMIDAEPWLDEPEPTALIIRVSAHSSVTGVAGAIAHTLRQHGHAEVSAIGAGAVNQAVKAIAVAVKFMADEGKEAVCVPTFTDREIDGQVRTAIRFDVTIKDMEMSMADVYADIKAERAYQDAKWGTVAENPHTRKEWVAIISGELHEAAVPLEWPTDDERHTYRSELVQVAASAVAAIEQYDLEHTKEAHS